MTLPRQAILVQLLLLLPLGAGCSSSPLSETPPPSGLDPLALHVGEPLELSEPRGLSSRDAEESFVRGPRRSPPVRLSATRDPASDAALSCLLDRRPVLAALGRLACLEVRGTREYVSVDCFGDPEVSSEEASFWARPAQTAQLQLLRNVLRLPAQAERFGAWPTVSSQLRRPFGAIVSVPSMLLPTSGSLRHLRLAGARVGAEAILILTRSTRVYRYHNGFANLYPLLVGFALPAREEVAVSRVEAALVGVRTGHVFAVAVGEARVEESGWLLLRDREDSRAMASRAEEDATYRMASDLTRELTQLEAEGRLVARAAVPTR
ncbi:MAG: hypothetical protein JKY65_22850 [Planctomycetes bacterium]|nr:hypothetical protein [Planctomycetota bacterium]